MARRVFFSFHYKQDSQRVQQVKQMGKVEGQPVLSSNEWEKIKRGGDDAIKEWINNEMRGKSCVVVLIGSQTAGRRWVKHEIKKAWGDGKGLVGIYIHNLKDLAGNQSSKGLNPFADFTLDGNALSSVVKAYDPPFLTSTYVYDNIKDNIASWVEEAVSIRNNYS
jgi:MTH538 TIR-like domain (DUF1863)